MADTLNKQQKTLPIAPDFLAWHVTQKGDKSCWNMRDQRINRL
ncbi:hypothetical protein [Rhodovulum visakhapatnamense]|uniref:Uncharacterized protein n=1 Tax=Rhodovulum visakhapatnamense TaxID=364297 RepID=A0A4R8F6U3_9RHOB|nr:hypothetical protein [Rhodovulum visakhapatnamense]TDX21250.1 hypothetical protein EV657_1439 [Rhodovulum visakhapatnamense]